MDATDVCMCLQSIFLLRSNLVQKAFLLRLTTNSKIYDFGTGELLDGPSLLALSGAECRFMSLSCAHLVNEFIYIYL